MLNLLKILSYGVYLSPFNVMLPFRSPKRPWIYRWTKTPQESYVDMILLMLKKKADGHK